MGISDAEKEFNAKPLHEKVNDFCLHEYYQEDGDRALLAIVVACAVRSPIFVRHGKQGNLRSYINKPMIIRRGFFGPITVSDGKTGQEHEIKPSTVRELKIAGEAVELYYRED